MQMLLDWRQLPGPAAPGLKDGPGLRPFKGVGHVEFLPSYPWSIVEFSIFIDSNIIRGSNTIKFY
jgi:hypothetical protein